MPIAWWEQNAGSLEMYNTECSRFDLIKTRREWNCSVCNKRISPGSYVLGSGYGKTCLGCAEKFLDNFLHSLDVWKNNILRLKEKLKKNEAKYLKHNLASAL